MVGLFLVGCGTEGSTPTTVASTTTTAAATTTTTVAPTTTTTTTYIGPSTTSTTTSTTTVTIPVQTSYAGLTLEWTTNEVIAQWGAPDSISSVGSAYDYNYSGSGYNKIAEFLNETNKLVKIGYSGSGYPIGGISYTETVGVLVGTFGSPEKTTETGFGPVYLYNSQNIAFLISTGESYANRVIWLYVLDGTVY